MTQLVVDRPGWLWYTNSEVEEDAMIEQDSLPIEALDLTTRVYRVMKRLGINTVGALAQQDIRSLSARNLGLRGMAEVEERLADLPRVLAQLEEAPANWPFARNLRLQDGQVVPDDRPDDALTDAELVRRRICQMRFIRLSERDQGILASCYSLHGQPAESYAALGRRYGVARTRISQIQAGAARKLRLVRMSAV